MRGSDTKFNQSSWYNKYQMSFDPSTRAKWISNTLINPILDSFGVEKLPIDYEIAE